MEIYVYKMYKISINSYRFRIIGRDGSIGCRMLAETKRLMFKSRIIEIRIRN